LTKSKGPKLQENLIQMKSISNSQFSNFQNSQITSIKDSVKNNGVTTLDINESSINNFVNNYNNNNNIDKIKTLNNTIRKKTASENSKQEEEEEENKSTFDKIVR
jgi:hypothetical protein